jgi:tRNA G37 N-methylase TrmD
MVKTGGLLAVVVVDRVVRFVPGVFMVMVEPSRAERASLIKARSF